MGYPKFLALFQPNCCLTKKKNPTTKMTIPVQNWFVLKKEVVWEEKWREKEII